LAESEAKQEEAPPATDPVRRVTLWVLGLALLLFGVALAAPAVAEDGVPPDEGGLVQSMGQPPRFMPYAGLGVGAYRPADDDTDVTGRLTLGLFKNLLGPVVSIGLAGEGYVGARGASIDGGIRGLVSLRPLRFGVGIDYNIPDNSPDLLLSFLHPLRRGGPFGLGGRLRVDYLPTRDHGFQVGFVVPLGQSWMGRTRPETDHVSIFVPKHSAVRSPVANPDLIETLAHVRDAADWINRFTTPFFDPAGGSREESVQRFVERVKRFKQHIAERSALYPEGRSYPAEIRVYHEELDRAFSIAASGGAAGQGAGESTPLGREISARAREILLEEVVLPYNRLLGRIKKPDSTLGYAARARDAFDLWLNREPRIAAGARPTLRHVLQAVLDEIEENREGSARYWETSELVWIPLHLALRPEQLETQAQLDRLVERAVGETFSGGNEHYYVINEQFQWELLRHIRSAEDYHVLWIHDFRGVGNDKQADEIGFAMVLRGYLETLIRRVRAYDTTGKLPTYLIFLDQNFYEPNRGRIWMSFLEDPLHAKVNLPGGDDAREKEAAIAKAQQELRAAVAESTLLQQRARTYGDDWLRNRIRVHVNITNPVDWSYWSQRVLPLLGLPDVVMRDHRKISFYDVTESDPGKGEAIFTGMGVGDHYAGPTWEDRAILVSGPSLVGLKGAAREMLLQQGFGEEEIPHPLLPQPKPNDYGERIARREAEGHRFRAMQIHNQTGYGPKPINVAKAILYDAMPDDSLMIVPDSLWNSPFWAGMLVGNALRGGQVFVISPALENAPSAGFPQMSRAQEIFAQMILIQQMLQDELASMDGGLHTGIYAVDLDVGDLAGRTALYYDNLLTGPLAPTWFGVTPEADPARWSELVAGNRRNKAHVLGKLAELGFEPGYVVEDVELRRPKLHLKAQVFLSRAALNLFAQVDWTKIVEETMVQRARQVGGEEYVDIRETWKTTSRLWQEESRKLRAQARPEDVENAIGYLTVGSHNMDYRGMMMDGEVLYVTAGGGLIPGLRDLTVIAAISTWVDDLEELEKLIPAYSEWQRRVGRYIKYAL
jgi:hypothetical protein